MAMHEAIAWTIACDHCREVYIEIIGAHDEATQEALDSGWTWRRMPAPDADIWHCPDCPQWCGEGTCPHYVTDCPTHY